MYVKISLWYVAGLSLIASLDVNATPEKFVGRAACAGCHEGQAALWAGSHHDMAMQSAAPETVLGDFNKAQTLHYGVTSTFYRKDDEFWVQTDGPDGMLRDYKIRYAFGVEPLQQYLIEFPDGRLQALSIAWDTRPKDAGGQRWFHLYPNEKIGHDDALHWTKPSQNWNSMCAECHSTHLQKNYDPATGTFSTSWSEIDVSCEACHGPGADHLSWAERKTGWEKLNGSKGLPVSLNERKDVHWKMNAKTGNAVRSQPRSGEKEIEICARCHSRRTPISRDYVHGEAFLDHYLPRRLDEGMYFADGQIDDEVYVYGSFLQSKMYHAGVTCSDCHEPHSLSLRIPGNGVCLQCHQAEKYNKRTHHFHQPGSDGARCAQCHMPPKTYMIVDPRHDHSMRIPRPDLSVTLGTPNACNSCHRNKPPEWALEKVRAWYGHTPKGYQTYAVALSAARQGTPDAGKQLAALIRDARTPDIARATALSHIGPFLDNTTVDVVTDGLANNDPAVRAAAVGALDYLPVEYRIRLVFPRLEDPVRAVRAEAARVLASSPAGELPEEQRSVLEEGLKTYIEAQQAMAERPEA